MTGYGRGDCSQDGFKITVELSSVNRKQSEISVNLPREMELLEAQIRDLINRYIARGRLTVRVSLHAGAGKAVGADAPERAAGQGLRAGVEPPVQAAQAARAGHAGPSGPRAGRFPDRRGTGGGGGFLAGGGEGPEEGAGARW